MRRSPDDDLVFVVFIVETSRVFGFNVLTKGLCVLLMVFKLRIFC